MMKLGLAIKYALNILVGKKSYVFVSILLSTIISISSEKLKLLNKLYEQINIEENLIPVAIIIVIIGITFLFIFIDFITGIIASRRKGDEIKSFKMGKTVSKFFGLFLYSFIACTIILLLTDNYFILILLYGPLILNLLKEYISIGENLESIDGKKAYMFIIIDKVFDILEMRFFKVLKEKNIRETKENDYEPDNFGKDYLEKSNTTKNPIKKEVL